MSRTLVIILSETRAHELTFDNFKKNVIDELDADLCVCIGVKPDYDYTNPFYTLSKHKFVYQEPTDFGNAFEYAYNIITSNRISKYEKMDNINTLYGKISSPQQSTTNITYYGVSDKFTNVEDYNDDEIVVHTNDFKNDVWKNQMYGIKNARNNNNNVVNQYNVITYKKHLHWREFLKIKDQFMGGVMDPHHQHPGSAGILIFFRWFLLKNLVENDLISQYDRFVITRSDFIYQLPHPKLHNMDEKYIWIPDGENYGGYTDRHVVLSKRNIESYLDIFNQLVLKSNTYFIKMNIRSKKNWNLERLIAFHLEQHKIRRFVKKMPYIMYSVRTMNGTTRWKMGKYSTELGYCIKYQSEYEKSCSFKKMIEKSQSSSSSSSSSSSHDNFYTWCIHNLNHTNTNT